MTAYNNVGWSVSEYKTKLERMSNAREQNVKQKLWYKKIQNEDFDTKKTLLYKSIHVTYNFYFFFLSFKMLFYLLQFLTCLYINRATYTASDFTQNRFYTLTSGFTRFYTNQTDMISSITLSFVSLAVFFLNLCVEY